MRSTSASSLLRGWAFIFRKGESIILKRLTFILVISITLLFNYCDTKKSESDKIVIAASIPPIADFARNVGGDFVKVFTVVPPGANPHTFKLTTTLMQRIADADMLVINGLELEYWADKVIDNVPDTRIVDTSKGLFSGKESLHAPDGHVNPHVWLDPDNAVYQISRIRDALKELDSEHDEKYENQAKFYIYEIRQLQGNIQEEIATWQRKRFVCFHPAWAYFAEHFGLVMAGVIEKRPGSEPTPKDIAEIIEKVKAMNAKAIFTEAQFPSKVSEMIATESGVSVIPLDPLGGLDHVNGYLEILRYNVSQMAKGLKK